MVGQTFSWRSRHSRFEADLSDFNVGYHASCSGLVAVSPLELYEMHMLFESIKESSSVSTKRNPAELGKPLLLKPLAVEVSVLCHQNSLSLQGGHCDYWIGRISGDPKPLSLHAMSSPLKVATQRIWHIVVEKEGKLDCGLRHQAAAESLT
jgi:hypothetical protein